MNLTPGSLRAGGATFLLEQGIAVSNIRFVVDGPLTIP